ncbi:MAG: hypothetical protein MJY47_02450 [Fibrobacter sp.]|nr:hypothetical protein [Fibrobacter sp.]
MKQILFAAIFALLLIPAATHAAIDAEMEGMEAVSRDDGTFLIGGPTYQYNRILGAGGLHTEGELWTPQKLRQRLLFNRMSILPSWDPIVPSVWIKTGNELGDMIYQDLITETNRPDNRTPIMEAGFRTPSFKGFWATARGFQDDYYSARTVNTRKKWVDDEFSLFGENWPMFSTVYAGLGFTNNFVNASVLAGTEYLWLYTASSRWIPVHYSPRVEARIDIAGLSLTAAYEDAEYQNFQKKEKGNRKEWNGSALYSCGSLCKNGILDGSIGVAFRTVEDSGIVYTKLEDDFVLWPFAELIIKPTKRITAAANFGGNNKDWLVQDSIEYRAPAPQNAGATIGIKNISGTRLNPLADDAELYGKTTIDLTPSGQMNLLQSYMQFEDTLGFMSIGGRATLWAEYGAETFEPTEFIDDGPLTYRKGDVARINEWIKGLTGEIWLGLNYQEMFAFKALGGFERIEGPEERFEVEPSEFFTAFTGDWLFRKSFRISHSLRYRSDAEWNLRSENPFVVKGDWYWDMTVEQQFPKQGLFLTGTLIHALTDEAIQIPNGDYDRIRLVCTIKKTF